MPTTPTATVTTDYNPYRMSGHTYRVTVEGIGTSAGFYTVEAAELAGERIAAGVEEPQIKGTHQQRMTFRVAGAGRLMGR